FAGWQMNLQYRPFVWISSRETIKDFAAAAADLRTVRRINGTWHWTLDERFRYSPSHANEEQGLDIGGVHIGNAFLSTGRNVLTNSVAGTLMEHYCENSSLLFHATQTFTRVSSYLGFRSPDNTDQQAVTFSSGAVWRDHYSLRNTLSLQYGYRVQTATTAEN